MAVKKSLTYQVVNNQSLSASFTTSPTVIQYLDNCSYQINTTTTNSIGTFSIQASNDYMKADGLQNVANAGNWVDLTLGGSNNGVPTINAASTNLIIDLNQLPFTAIRLSYTPTTAGTGTCNIILTAKELG